MSRVIVARDRLWHPGHCLARVLPTAVVVTVAGEHGRRLCTAVAAAVDMVVTDRPPWAVPHGRSHQLVVQCMAVDFRMPLEGEEGQMAVVVAVDGLAVTAL